MGYRDRDYYGYGYRRARDPRDVPWSALIKPLAWGFGCMLLLGLAFYSCNGGRTYMEKSREAREAASAEGRAEVAAILGEDRQDPNQHWTAEDQRWSDREVRKLQRAVEKDAEQAVKPQEGAGGSPGQKAEDGSEVPSGFYGGSKDDSGGGTNSGCKSPKITYGDAGGGTGEATIGSGCSIELNRAKMNGLSPRMQCTVIKHETAHLHGQEHTSSGWMAPHISEGDYAPGC